MDRWDEDREILLHHWRRLGLIHRIILLFLFRFPTFLPSFFYLLDRAAMQPTKMMKVKELHWDTIQKFLERNILK